MKRKLPLTLLLALTAMSASATTIESFEVHLDELLFTPNSNNSYAGTMRFSSIDLLADDMFFSLSEAAELFDSKIYLRDNFLGIRGENHAIGVNIDTAPFKVVENLELANSSAVINESKISFDSDLLKTTVGPAEVELDAFRLFCKKHPEYPEISIDSFKYGCLSYSTFNSKKQGENVTLNLKLNELTEDSLTADITSQIENIEFKEKRIYMSSPETVISMQGLINANIRDMRLLCNKDGNIDNFTPEKLIFDCIDNVTFNIGEIDANGTLVSEESDDQNYTVKSSGSKLALNDNEVMLKTNSINLELGDTTIEAKNIHLACEKNDENITNYDVNALVNTCLKTSQVRKLNGRYATAEFDTKIGDEGLNVKTELNQIEIKGGVIAAMLGYTQVGLESGITFGIHSPILSCVSDIQSLNFDQEEINEADLNVMMDSCINNFTIPSTKIVGKNNDRFGRYFIDVNSAKVEGSKVIADLNSVQLVGEDGSSTLFGLKMECDKDLESEVYDYKKLISSCLRSGEIKLGHSIDDEDNDEVPGIYETYDKMFASSGVRLNPSELVSGLKKSMKDLVVTSEGNKIDLRVKAKVLGSYKSVQIKGLAHFDEENEKVTIKVTKTKLPFGISGIKFSLWIIKKVIGSDRIDVDSSGKTITIDLKY